MSQGTTPPSLYYHVPTVLDQKIFPQVFSYINVQIFNSLLLRRECCTFSHGEYVKAGLAELELWCNHVTSKVIHQKSKISYVDLTTDLCPALSVQQLYRICTLYWDDHYNTPSVDLAVISTINVHAGSEDSENTSFLLKDDPCIPFLVDDLISLFNEKDFAKMKNICASRL